MADSATEIDLDSVIDRLLEGELLFSFEVVVDLVGPRYGRTLLSMDGLGR